MAAQANAFMDKVFVGTMVSVGTSEDKYRDFLMVGERVEREFKGIRDAMIFTDRRIMVLDAQGILGRKLGVTSFPWKSITAYSVENSGTADLDAELKICGSGWGVCEVQLTKGSKMPQIAQFINEKLFS